MSLLENARKEAQVEATPAVETEAVGKKKSNSEYQKRQRELAQKYGKIVKDYIDSKKDAPEEVKEAANWLGRERSAGNGGSVFGKPVLYKLFGDTPKKGDKLTALEVFEKTGKGFAEMRQLMKKWLEKQNVTVKYDEKAKAYVVDSNVPEYKEA